MFRLSAHAERGRVEVGLTALGEAIVAQALQVIDQVAAIKETAKSGKDTLNGPLRLGIIYTIGPTCCPIW